MKVELAIRGSSDEDFGDMLVLSNGALAPHTTLINASTAYYIKRHWDFETLLALIIEFNNPTPRRREEVPGVIPERAFEAAQPQSASDAVTAATAEIHACLLVSLRAKDDVAVAQHQQQDAETALLLAIQCFDSLAPAGGQEGSQNG